jgi:predicted PurR-regulated permease PerM
MSGGVKLILGLIVVIILAACLASLLFQVVKWLAVAAVGAVVLLAVVIFVKARS